MKRKYVDVKCSHVFPLFWQKCDFCDIEFKFERGWWCERKKPPYYDSTFDSKCICPDCADTEEKALQLYTTWVHQSVSPPKNE